MPIKNTNISYGLVAQILHWAVALLVLALFGLGFFMSQLTFETKDQVDFTFTVFSLHKTLGLTVFVLAVARILWALTQVHPYPLKSHKPPEVLAAQVVHWLLYVTIFAMPLTGWLHHSATQGLAPIWGPFPQRLGFVPQTEFAEIFWGWSHYMTAWIMGGIIALHIAGGIKHAVIDRDGTLRRIIPGLDHPGAEIAGHVRKRLPAALTLVIITAVGAGIFFSGPTQDTRVEIATPTSKENHQSNWTVNKEQSQLWIEVTQNGNPIKGQFGVWAAEILYNPETPETARLSVEIDVTSLDLGAVSQQAHSAGFLNSTNFPKALFTAEGFTPLDDGRFETIGTLDLVGKSLPVALSFKLELTGDVATAAGQANIIRHDFEIGSEDPMVGSSVTVNFDLQAVLIER